LRKDAETRAHKTNNVRGKRRNPTIACGRGGAQIALLKNGRTQSLPGGRADRKRTSNQDSDSSANLEKMFAQPRRLAGKRGNS